MSMQCSYCGHDRGEKYRCLNCNAPKEFINEETGEKITSEQFECDVAKVLDFCGEYTKDRMTLSAIKGLAMFTGISGTTLYFDCVTKTVKEILDNQFYLKETAVI